MNSELEDLRRSSQSEWRAIGKYKRIGMDFAEAEIAMQGGLRDEEVDPRKCMEKLSKTEKRVLHYIIEGFSKHEICEIMRISETNYSSIMSRMTAKVVT